MSRNKKQPNSMAIQSKFADHIKANVQRSKFNRSHGLKTTFGGLYPDNPERENVLVPIYLDEILPGDTFKMKSTAFMRLSTPLHPIMDNIFIDIHYFFVPNRLVWDNWQRFMGERDDPDDDPAAYTVPTHTITVPENGSGSIDANRLQHYFGLPLAGGQTPALGMNTYSVNELPFRAYRLIWNEWYRDQNIQDTAPFSRGDGANPVEIVQEMFPRGKRKDYFTSALPWPQKGDPVHIPVTLEGFANVVGDISFPGTGDVMIGGVGPAVDPPLATSGGPFGLYTQNFVNVENTTTINDLRTAFQIQKLLERDARGGTRYIELILSHFGVQSSDARLQRPEYLGGGSSRVAIQPVPNTAGVAGENNPAQGDLAGYGTTINTARFKKSFTEHGFIIGLASYRSDLTYQRGIERMWNRTTRYDYYWPALAHLGEQAITNKELNFTGLPNNDNAVFGYQERYGEYRYKPSRVTGLFNSDAPASLDPWHLAQDFDPVYPVTLSPEFIEDTPPIDRAIAVPTEPYFIADIWFDLHCTRAMPTYAVPGMVDHF